MNPGDDGHALINSFFVYHRGVVSGVGVLLMGVMS